MAENTNLMSTYLAREALTLKLAPRNLDGTGDSREFSDYGPLTLRFYSANIFTNQPTTYGFLLNIADGTKRWEMHQLWLEQPSGDLYHRGTNATTYDTDPAFKKILDDSNYASVLDDVYVNVNGDTMTGSLTFTNNNGIYYQGTQASYPMIKFIDNTSDTYGNGIAIGGGGQAIIGGGESANVAIAQAGTAGAEIMYVCNDGDVLIHSNMQNGWDSRKTWTFSADGSLTVPGAVNFANNTYNKLGDDVQFGDVNQAGAFGIQGLNGVTNIRFIQYNGTSAGYIAWDGTQFSVNNNFWCTGAGDHFVIAKNTTTGSTVYLDSGGSTNHGIYSAGYYNGTSFTSDPKWLVYRDSGNNILLNGDAVRAKFGDSANGTHDSNSMGTNGFYYYNSNGPAAASQGSEAADGAMFVQAYSTSWVGQIAQDYRTGQLWARGKNNNSWASWKKVVMADETSTAVTNCNSVKHTGIWTHSGFTNRPSKVTNWGSLFNIRLYKDNNNYHRQLFFDCYATNRIWTRSNNAGTWTVWREVLTNATTFSVKTNVTFTNGYGTYRDDRIAGNSKVIVGGNNSGSTGVVFSVETFTGGVGIHACKVYNGAGGTLSWSGTLNNIYIFVDNSDV